MERRKKGKKLKEDEPAYLVKKGHDLVSEHALARAQFCSVTAEAVPAGTSATTAAPPPPLSASRQSGSLRPTCRRRLPSLRSAAARGLSRGGSHTVTPPRATRLTAARPSPRSFPPSFLSTHLHVRRRSCLGAGEMKLMAPPVLKPSSSGACGSSTSSDGGGPGSEAFLLANATYVSHFGYFQHGAPREFIVFVVRTVAQRTQPGQHEADQWFIALKELYLFIYVRCPFM
ncbi:hypothetical protein BRADI_5g19522v3 [Brachypodium distachyon]|uniref:Uncharacterized protein n=1 Tax=Brachypodium distachyon TaxID=15368 RepID=A0A2K2CI71_BRADI|nr:hypothetical protein BRADI_5g19522v3 [Brachypodium distachyon]